MMCPHGIPQELELCFEDVKAIGSLTETVISDGRCIDSHGLCIPSHDLHCHSVGKSQAPE